MKKAYDLGCGHMGNGLVIWNRAREVHGDYERVAHINAFRIINFHIDNLTKEVVNYVKRQTVTNPSVSVSQPEKKVFYEEYKKCSSH